MTAIVETAATGNSRSAYKDVKSFNKSEASLAVVNYHERVRDAAREYLSRQAKLADEKIDMFVQRNVMGEAERFRCVTPFNEFRSDSVILSHRNAVPSPFFLMFLGLLMLAMGLSISGDWTADLDLMMLSLVAMSLVGLGPLVVGFGLVVLFSEYSFMNKTGYHPAVQDDVLENSASTWALTKNYLFVSSIGRNDTYRVFAYNRHAFKDIERIVRSEIDDEVKFMAFDHLGEEMFEFNSMRTPKGVDAAVELERRIQAARGAAAIESTQ